MRKGELNMKTYNKPDFFVNEFEPSESVASCQKVVTGTQVTTTYPAQSVTCAIGGQSEVVFNSGTTGCNTSASKYAFGYYDGVYYFCWYADTGMSGTTPTNAQKALMASVTGVSDPRNWHYCAVTSETISTDILGFSY